MTLMTTTTTRSSVKRIIASFVVFAIAMFGITLTSAPAQAAGGDFTVSPAVGPLAGGNIVTLDNFQDSARFVSSVQFGGKNITSFTRSLNTLSFAAPASSETTAGPAGGAVSVTAVSAIGGTGSEILYGTDYTYSSVPTISQISPSSTAAAGGSSITVTGTSFTPGTSVTVGGANVASTIVNSSQLTFVAPAYVSGPLTVNVVITNGQGSATGTLTYIPSAVPQIASFSPSTVTSKGGTTVVITGTNFTGVTSVSFLNTPAASFTVDSATQITAVTPTHAAGTGNVVVATTSQSGVKSGFTYVQAPTLTSINSASGDQDGGRNVILTGTNLTGTTSVKFGTKEAVFTVNSATQIVVTTPAMAPGVYPITATNPYGVTNGINYTYVNADPTITSVTPNSGVLSGGNTITVRGSYLNGAQATIGGTPVTPSSASSQLTLYLTVPAGATLGNVDIIITTQYGTAKATYTYVPPAPIVTSLSPDTGDFSGGDTVTINGSNFTQNSTVKFGNADATILSITPTQITAVSPAVAAGTPGSSNYVYVLVTNPGGTNTATVPDRFTYTTPFNAPVITDISPNSYGTKAGGNIITISGTDFDHGVSAVRFGDQTLGASLTTDNTIVIRVPAGTGTIPIVVVGRYAESAPVSYTYGDTPVVNGGKASGTTIGGNTITISGKNFTDAKNTVHFGDVDAKFTVVDDSTLEVVVPKSDTEKTVNITVESSFGTSQGSFTYTYRYLTPVVNNVTPSSGYVTGGNTVTIEGDQFSDVDSVSFGGNLATNVTVVDDNTITVTAPEATDSQPGYVQVTVYGAHEAGYLSNAYLYKAPEAHVDSISPDHGSVNGGTAVTLTGTGFTGIDNVFFGNNEAASFTVVSDTKVTAVSPAYDYATGVRVLATKPGTDYTSEVIFNYDADAPTIESVTPNHGSVDGYTEVTVKGTGFSHLYDVNFGGNRTYGGYVVNDSTLVVYTPAGKAGLVDLTVIGNQGSAVFKDAFTYGPQVSISSVTPSSGYVTGGESITIAGANFTSDTVFTIGGIVAEVQQVTPTKAVVTAPKHDGAGKVDVTASDPNNYDATVADGYTYLAVPKTEVGISSVTPSYGPKAGGDTVIINGQGFLENNVTALRFGNVNAPDFKVISDSQISVVTPASDTTGEVAISLDTDESTFMSSVFYDYINPQISITNVTPNTGSVKGGNLVTITGKNFAANTSVYLDDSLVKAVSVTSTEIQFYAPAHNAGSVSVYVVSNRQSARVNNAYTYIDEPVVITKPAAITGFTPKSGPETGGNVVTIAGSNFTSATDVSFGQQPADFKVVSDTEIQAVAPAGTGNVNISVTNPDAQAVSTDSYTYVAATSDNTPVIDKLGTNKGTSEGGNTLVITGKNFTGATRVLFGATDATSFKVISDTEIDAVAPAGNGTVRISVITADGVALSAGTYEYVTPDNGGTDPGNGTGGGTDGGDPGNGGTIPGSTGGTTPISLPAPGVSSGTGTKTSVAATAKDGSLAYTGSEGVGDAAIAGLLLLVAGLGLVLRRRRLAK